MPFSLFFLLVSEKRTNLNFDLLHPFLASALMEAMVIVRVMTDGASRGPGALHTFLSHSVLTVIL